MVACPVRVVAAVAAFAAVASVAAAEECEPEQYLLEPDADEGAAASCESCEECGAGQTCLGQGVGIGCLRCPVFLKPGCADFWIVWGSSAALVVLLGIVCWCKCCRRRGGAEEYEEVDRLDQEEKGGRASPSPPGGSPASRNAACSPRTPSPGRGALSSEIRALHEEHLQQMEQQRAEHETQMQGLHERLEAMEGVLVASLSTVLTSAQAIEFVDPADPLRQSPQAKHKVSAAIELLKQANQLDREEGAASPEGAGTPDRTQLHHLYEAGAELLRENAKGDPHGQGDKLLAKAQVVDSRLEKLRTEQAQQASAGGLITECNDTTEAESVGSLSPRSPDAQPRRHQRQRQEEPEPVHEEYDDEHEEQEDDPLSAAMARASSWSSAGKATPKATSSSTPKASGKRRSLKSAAQTARASVSATPVGLRCDCCRL